MPIADCGAPIRAEDGSIRGVVLVFRDQSEARRAQRAIEEARAFAESIVATIRQPLLVLESDLRVVSANRYFYHFFQIRPEETTGRLVYELGNRQWDIPELRQLLEAILPQNTAFDDFAVEHDFEGIGRRTMLLNARRLHYEDEKTQLILLAIEDITERKQVKQSLEREARRLKVLHQASQQIALAGNDPEQVYAAIHSAVAQLMPAEAFVITLCEDVRQEAQAVYLIDKDGRYPPQRFPPGSGLTGLIVATGQPLLVSDLASESDITRILA
jgi:PAS domain-containing protein